MAQAQGVLAPDRWRPSHYPSTMPRMVSLPATYGGREELGPLPPRRRVEVGFLVRDPGNELRDLRVGPQGLSRRIASHELLVGHRAMDDAVTDRVYGLGLASPAALGDRVVPFDPTAKRAATQEADRRPLAQRRNQCSRAKNASTARPTTMQKPTTPQKAQGSSA